MEGESMVDIFKGLLVLIKEKDMCDHTCKCCCKKKEYPNSTRNVLIKVKTNTSYPSCSYVTGCYTGIWKFYFFSYFWASGDKFSLHPRMTILKEEDVISWQEIPQGGEEC